MGRLKMRRIHLGTYHKCLLCDYEIKNNKRALKLHYKYSHPEEEFGPEEEDRLRCAVCKKGDCKLH